LSIDTNFPSFWLGDPTRISQIIMNLLSNAFKFTENGEIALVIKKMENNHLWASVKDTGVGIPLECQEKVFQRFNQVDSTTTRRYGGTGLGLAIVKQLVNLMNGEIKLISTVGKGSEFQIQIPIEPSLKKSQSVVPAEVKITPIRATVLTVEDNFINLKIIQTIVSGFGSNVLVATTGKEALAIVACHPIDLIFMDIQMPDMDGFEITKWIRAQEAPGQHVPIIAVTADILIETKEKCESVGIDDFIPKPYNRMQIWEMMKKYILDKEG